MQNSPHLEVPIGTAEAFVGDLYRTILGREPDPEGLRHFSERRQGGVSEMELITTFLNGKEYQDRQLRLCERKLAARAKQTRRSTSESRPEPRKSTSKFPLDYQPPGEAGRCYVDRVVSGFLDRYCDGDVILDVGFSGYENPEGMTALPDAIGVDLDFPGYDGVTLPFADGSVDTVFSSHCLEHILYDHAAIRDWYRVLRIGGFIVCMVPSQALYEKKRFLPSRWNADHKRMYTPASLAGCFEQALETNSFRIRHLAENDRHFNYALGPDTHSDGAYEIEIVVEKILKPKWTLA